MEKPAQVMFSKLCLARYGQQYCAFSTRHRSETCISEGMVSAFKINYYINLSIIVQKQLLSTYFHHA